MRRNTRLDIKLTRMDIGLIDVDGNVMYAYAQPYRDPTKSHHEIPLRQKDMAQWCNKRMIFTTTEFRDFSPRKGFRCEEYFLK